MVTANVSESLGEPLYTEDITNQNTPAFQSLLQIVQLEASSITPAQRLDTYRNWLLQGHPLQVLFAAEALSRDPLPGIDEHGHLAQTFSNVFLSNSDPYLKVSVAHWMWQGILEKTTPVGRKLILDATIMAISSDDQSIRDFALDQLLLIDEKALLDVPLQANFSAAKVIQAARHKDKSDPADQRRLALLVKLLERSD